MTIETRYARCGNAGVAYQTIGEGEIDLVYVPCWISHLERLWREPRFARFIERLSTFGRVILFDKRGTGLSDPAPATRFPSLEERIEDLLTVLDAAGSRRPVLIGSALGGRLSALFAATHPERVSSLVIFGAGARGSWAPDYPWAPTAEEHEQHVAQIQREWGGPVMVEAYAASAAHDPAFRRWWAECLRSGASPATAVAAERLSAETDVRHSLPRIQAPSLVLHRLDDRLVDVAAGRHLAGQIPNARFVELPGSDHLPFVGDQETLFAAIEGFLAETTGARPRPRVARTLATVVVADVLGATDTSPRSNYQSTMRETLARLDGRPVSTTASGIVATFDRPARAGRFAAAITAELRRLGLLVRIGLHTGEVEIDGGEIGGRGVHLAMRIAAQARPGETLVSETVVGLVIGSDLSFAPVEDREPTGLPADVRLFRLADPSLPTTAPIVGTTLAAPLSPREREVAGLVALGRSNRQIGLDLMISTATVERHVANIMTKLSVRSRAQIAAWFASDHRSRPRLPAPALVPGHTVFQVAIGAD